MLLENRFATKALTCSLIAAALLSGCITSSYPEDWSGIRPASTSQCPDLTGSYENFGLWSDGDRIDLASLFFPLRSNEPMINNNERKAVTHVSFGYADDNSLAIKAWVSDQILMERQLTASQLSCNAGQNVYHESSWGLDGVAPVLPVLYNSSIDRLLLLASDGSLLIENHESTKGIAIVIPFLVKGKYWFKFSRISPLSSDLLNEDNRPRGVRTGVMPAYRLLPPEGASKWLGYNDAGACLEQSAQSQSSPDPKALALLGGRSTQAFILQNGKDGALLQNGSMIGNTWMPSTHGLRVEKQHWKPPSVADRYVLCLLAKGYRWDAPAIAPRIQNDQAPAHNDAIK